jgi:hypothetical protein
MIQRSGQWWMEARPISEADRSFDIAFWQSQSPSDIFRAAWELVELAAKMKGQEPSELRLQRTVGTVRPIWG